MASQECSAVLLVNDQYGTSTTNRQVAQIITGAGRKVYSAVVKATLTDRNYAKADGVELILPTCSEGDTREPSLDWLTFDHRTRYPRLPQDVRCIVGHADVTSKAAVAFKELRFPQANLGLVVGTIPEDTEKYKSEEKAMGIGRKEESIRQDAEKADTVFSVGHRIHDHITNSFCAIPENKRPTHYLFLPKPSDLFQKTTVEFRETKEKVVLSIGGVNMVDKMKGLDLAAKSLAWVAERSQDRILWRICNTCISKEEYQASMHILQASINSGKLKPTLLTEGTQEDICRHMQQAHLVLMPSRTEPFGLLGLEAMAAGVPVLISDQSGLASLVDKVIPEFHPSVLEIEGNDSVDVARWAGQIEKVLRKSKAEFSRAAELKAKLLESRYWEESHQCFLQACGDLPDLDLAVIGRDRTDRDRTDDITRQVQSAVQTTKKKSQQQMEGRLKTMRGQRETARQDTEAMVHSLTREVTRLKEEEKKAQKILLEQKLEIQELQESNRTMVAHVEELMEAKHTAKGGGQGIGYRRETDPGTEGDPGKVEDLGEDKIEASGKHDSQAPRTNQKAPFHVGYDAVTRRFRPGRLLLKVSVYRKVPFPVQEKLQRELDKDLATRNNWFKLAKILGYDEDYISIFEKQKSPSGAMFDQWKTHNENTVEKLVDALRQMRRYDVIEILEKEDLVPAVPLGLNKVIVLKEGYAYADGPGFQRADGSITLVKGPYNVIVDTGNPWDKQHILDGLQWNGLSPGDIQYVVCTHGHSDHVGNLNLFTKATHIVSYDISKMDKYTVHNFTGHQRSPYRIDDHIEVIATPGHTHSDVSVVVKNTDQGTVVIAGDLFECEEDLSCDLLWQEYSENKEMQEHHRQQVLKMADWIVPGHGRMFAVPEKYKGGL